MRKFKHTIILSISLKYLQYDKNQYHTAGILLLKDSKNKNIRVEYFY